MRLKYLFFAFALFLNGKLNASINSAVVFASPKEIHNDTAKELGEALAKNGLELTVALSNSGNMLHLAESAHKAGGKVNGLKVSEKLLSSLNETFSGMIKRVTNLTAEQEKNYSSLEPLNSLNQYDLKDGQAFILFPGGDAGEQAFRSALSKLLSDKKQINTKAIILNKDGFFDGLVQQLEKYYPKREDRLYHVAQSTAEVISLLDLKKVG